MLGGGGNAWSTAPGHAVGRYCVGEVDDAWAFAGQSIGRRRRQWALGRPIGLRRLGKGAPEILQKARYQINLSLVIHLQQGIYIVSYINKIVIGFMIY